MKLENYSNYEIYPEIGKVWSYKSNRFVGAKRGGYYITKLTDDNGVSHSWSIHRLIWFVVNGEIPEGYNIHHINHTPDDNRIENLELISQFEHFSMHHKGIKHSKEQVDKHKEKMLNRKDLSKSVVKVDVNGSVICVYPSLRQCERDNNISHSTMQYNVINKRLLNGYMYYYS